MGNCDAKLDRILYGQPLSELSASFSVADRDLNLDRASLASLSVVSLFPNGQPPSGWSASF